MARRPHDPRFATGVALGAVLLALVTPLAAAAQQPTDRGDAPAPGAAPEDRPGRGAGRHGFAGLIERYADRLGLDAATRERIRALADEGRASSDAERDALERLHDEMRSLLSADDPDEQAVLDKAEEIGRADTELRKQRLRTMLAIRAQLTPEQRRELVRIHEQMRAEWGAGRREGRFGPHRWRASPERE